MNEWWDICSSQGNSQSRYPTSGAFHLFEDQQREEAEAEGPIFGYLMQRTYSLEKTLMLGKIEDRRRRG